MKNVFLGRGVAPVQRAGRIVSLTLAFGTLAGATMSPAAQAQSRPKSMLSGMISPSRAERIARNYIGGNARVIHDEGIHEGMYRIHVHRNGVARHVFVGARSGRVIKTRIINPRADRREDRPHR